MADYAFRSYEERQKIQEMVEAGLSAKDIAASLGISPSAVYAELRRGRDGTRLPDKRLGYNAELAQLSVQQGLERLAPGVIERKLEALLREVFNG